MYVYCMYRLFSKQYLIQKHGHSEMQNCQRYTRVLYNETYVVYVKSYEPSDQLVSELIPAFTLWSDYEYF